MDNNNLNPVTAQAEQVHTHEVVKNGIESSMGLQGSITPDSKYSTKFLL